MPFENWESDNSHQANPTRIIIIALALILCIAIPVGAVYKITSAPSDPVEVTAPADLTKVSTNATQAIPGDKLVLSTTLTDGLSNVQVFFYENDVSIGSAYTDSNGIATLTHTLVSTGTKIYLADCIHP
jgi:hypothetical protein